MKLLRRIFGLKRVEFRAWFCGCEDFYTGEGKAALYDHEPEAGGEECHREGGCGWALLVVEGGHYLNLLPEERRVSGSFWGGRRGSRGEPL